MTTGSKRKKQCRRIVQVGYLCKIQCCGRDIHFCVVSRAICFKMFSQFVKFPNVAKAQVIAHHNSTMHLVPSLYCELYIPILPPSNGYRDHVNQKGWPSIVLQVLEDDQFHIKDICVGSPGSAAVFTTSNLIPDNPSVTLLVDFRGKWLYPYVSLII